MVPTTADSSISSTTATRTSTRTRISSTIIIRDMDRTRMETVTAITPQRRIHTWRQQRLSQRQPFFSVSYPEERCTEWTARQTPCSRIRAHRQVLPPRRSDRLRRFRQPILQQPPATALSLRMYPRLWTQLFRQLYPSRILRFTRATAGSASPRLTRFRAAVPASSSDRMTQSSWSSQTTT